MITQEQNQQRSLDNQESLSEKLLNIFNGLEIDSDSCVLNLEEFLDNNKSNEDLKFVLAHTQYKNEKTFLHHATKNNCLQAIELLLKAGADPNVQDQDGKTPLHHVADNQSDYDDIIRAFLEKGAKIDIQDKDGETPLHYVANLGHINGIDLFIEHSIKNKQNVNLQNNKDRDTALHLALKNADDERKIDPFLKDGLDIDFSIKNSEGITPLLAAVKNANLNVVESLLAKLGIKIDDKDNKYGGSILHHVMANPNISHTSPNTHSDTQQPDFECENEHDVTNRIINAVIHHTKKHKIGFDIINCTDNDGNTPLFVAVDHGRHVAVERLIEEGADVSKMNKSEYTVFHHAIRIRDLKMLKTLLPKKEKKDENGVTVTDKYDLPVEEIDAEKAKELLSVIDKEGDKEGNTLLHHAIKWGCKEEMINFLVEHGVDVNKKNNNRVAPIHIAAKYGHPDLTSCLIKNKANCSTKCGNLTKSHIDSIGREFPVVMDYINVQGSDINNSTVNTENDNAYKEATPILIAADGDNIDAVNVLASWGAKHDTQNDKGWDTLLIAIKRACSKDLIEEEKQKMCKVIGDLASTANLEILACLANMKRQVLEEQLHDRIKSLATNRLNDNNEILNVSVLPQVTGGKLGNLIQMSIEAKQLGQEKRYILKLFSKDKLLEPITDKEIQMYEKRVFNKLKNIIENTLKLSDDDEVQKIVKEAFHGALSAIESRSRTTALVDRNTDFDDNFYEKIGSGVKEIPELHYDTCANIEKENTESSVNQKKELPPEMDRGLKKFRDNINEFWKNAEDAIREGKLESLEVDNTTFFLECSEDSIVEVAKITDGARDLGLAQGDMAFGSNIVKIGKSEVEIITQKGIRNYTDLAGNSDIVLTFYTSKGELEVRLRPDVKDKSHIKVEVHNQGLLERLKNCNEKIGKNCLLGGLSVNEAIEQGFFDRPGKLRQPSETMSSSVNSSQQSHGYELKAAQPTKQQLLQDLCNVESNVTKKEKDFDTKTHLIDIFKILHKLLRDKENVSKTDLANVAEKESKRLGLEGRYNWNVIFGLEKAVSQNIEQEGSSLPLSSDLYRQDKLASSVSNKVEKCTTKGDGNCFFHAVFGDSSSGVYKTDRAKEMRQEWHKFLSQFESLDDPKMPKALRERLPLVFHNVFPMQELDFCTSNLYKEYLSKVNEQSYFIYVEEVPILASLANIEVEIHYTQKLPDKIKPNPGMINADYKTNQKLWGSKVQEAIYFEGNHYSRAEVTAQPQKDFPPYSESPRCGITEPMVESYQQGLFVK